MSIKFYFGVVLRIVIRHSYIFFTVTKNVYKRSLNISNIKILTLKH